MSRRSALQAKRAELERKIKDSRPLSLAVSTAFTCDAQSPVLRNATRQWRQKHWVTCSAHPITAQYRTGHAHICKACVKKAYALEKVISVHVLSWALLPSNPEPGYSKKNTSM